MVYGVVVFCLFVWDVSIECVFLGYFSGPVVMSVSMTLAVFNFSV